MGGKSGSSYRSPVEDPNTLQSQQEVTIIDVISEGPVVGLATDDAKSIALNYTPLMTEEGEYTFQNVAWDTREGTADQTAYANVEGAESETSVSVEITKDFPRASGSGSGSASRTISNLNVTKVRVTLGVRGLYETIKDDQDRAGDTIGSSVSYNIQITDKNGTVFINQNVTKNDKTTSSSQWRHLYSLANKEGPWTVKVSKTSIDNTDSAIQNNLYWESYTEIVGYKLIYPHTASILIKGTAETFGSSIPSRVYRYKGLILEVPSNYDPVTRTYTGIWNGTFKNAWSDNPAWVLRDLIEHDRYGLKKRFPPAVQGNPLIDKWTLYEIAKLCDTMVADGFGGIEPRYTFNGQIMGSGEAVTVIQSIASVFHGMTYWGSGSLFTITDYPSDPIRTVAQVNVIDGIFTYSTGSNQERHSVAVVTWYDPDDFGRSSTEIVYDWEMMQRIGYREINVTAYGCYSRGQAYRQGLWTLLSEQEQWQVSFSMGLDGYDLMVGDRIKIADPTWMGARLSGRVKAISSDKRHVTLDAPVTLATGEEYYFNIISKAGTEETKKITGISSDLQTITLEYALTGSFVDLCVWSISGTDVSPRIFAIRNIKEEKLGTITISAYRVLTDKYSQLENNVRLEETPGRRASVRSLPVPTGLDVIKGSYIENGSIFQRLTFSWDSSGNPDIAYYQASYKSPSGSWNDFSPKLFFSLDIPAASAGLWSFRVRSLALDGRTSEWATSNYTLTGPATIPLAPTDLTATGWFGDIMLKWQIPDDAIYDYTEVYECSINDLESAVFVARSYGNQLTRHVGDWVGRYYWVRCIGKNGVASDWNSDYGTYGYSDQESHQDFVDLVLQENPYLTGVQTDLNTAIALVDTTIKTIDLPDYEQRLANRINEINIDVQGELAKVSDAVTDALGNTYELDKKVRDAGIVVDPDDGTVRIWGLDQANGRISNVEINLDAVASTLTSKVTLAQVDERIAGAVFGDAGELLLSGVDARISVVEESLDAVEGTLTEKASVVDVNALGGRIGTAESRLDGQDAEIALLATSQELDAVESRVSIAEVNIDALEGSIVNKVVSTVTVTQDEEERIAQGLVDAMLNDQEGKAETQEKSRTALAIAESELYAHINDEMEAEAGQRLLLAAKVNNNQAAIQSEATARANADSAMASQITTLIADVGDNTAAIQTEATARADADSAIASNVTTLQTTVGENTSAIQTVNSSVNGIKSKHAVKIDTNGYVTGYELIGTGASSSMVFHVDNFLIGKPGASNDYPFALGVVDGVTRISMQNVFIQDAAIDTLKIKNNAVTTYVFVTGGQTSSWRTLYGTGSPTWRTMPFNNSVTVTQIVSGRPAMITFSVNWYSAEDYAGTSFRVLANTSNTLTGASAIWTKNVGGGDQINMSYTEQFQWIPSSSGTWYLYLQWLLGSGGDMDSKWNTYIRSHSLSLFHMKR